VWIYIPDKDETKEPWIGTITPPERSGSLWSFELIRHVDPSDTHFTPFDDATTAIGLLNHQQRCTLVRPRVLVIDPGSVGIRLPTERTRITGEFDALLTDLPVKDAEERNLVSLSFDSETFGAWYAPRAFSTSFDPKSRTHAVDISETARKVFRLPIGEVICTTGGEVLPEGRSATIRSAAILRIELNSPISLREMIDTCLGLERLFGFLIGFQGKLPTFKIALNQTYKIDKHELRWDGSLEIGGVEWQQGRPPHPMRCIHLQGQGGGTIHTILEKFFVDNDSILARIHSIDFCRHFTSNLNDRFSVIMPVLEAYLKRRYTSADEESYIQSEKAFFEWVDKADNDNIKEFSRKHLNVVNRKSPSLKTLLGRALEFVNKSGFSFPSDMSDRIASRRGKLFHSVAKMEEGEARDFQAEVAAATGLLLLHTFDDLGIDVASLAERPSGLDDIRKFFSEHERSSPAAPLPRAKS
jgi:hypothetical protein